MQHQQAIPLSPVAEGRVAAAAEFAETIIAPNARNWEATRTQPVEQLREVIRQFAGVAVPAELGGQGHNFSTLMRCYEELAARDLGFTCALAVHCNVTAGATRLPDPDLRSESVAALISGDSIGAFVLTEPDVGSDATAITTMATRQGDGFRLDGRKAWVTNGRNADYLLTFCQMDAAAGARGIACFALRRDQPGLRFSAPIEMIASHAMGTTDLDIDGVQAGPKQIAFDPGSAFPAAMSAINLARIGVAAMCNGALRGGLMTAVRYARQRKAFGRSIYDFQGIQFALAEAATQLEASRSLTFQAIYQLENGNDATVLAAHAKKFATATAFRNLSVCLQALGANGLKDEYGIHRQMSASRVCEFMDGTGEVQSLIVARALAAAESG